MKWMTKLAWVFCGIVTAILAVDAWRTWDWRDATVRHWRDELRRGDVVRRREAAVMLAQQLYREAVPDLIGLLGDPDEEVRVLAIQGVTRALVPTRSLEDPAGLPPGLVAGLKARLGEDPSARVRAWAIDALAMLAREDDEAHALFRGRLDDSAEDDSVRVAAYNALGQEWQASRDGARYCGDPSPALRRAAMECMLAHREGVFRGEGGLPADPYAEVAIRGLADPDPKIREVATRLLPRFPEESAEPWLLALPAAISALSAERQEIRLLACDSVWALTAGSVRADEGIAALTPLLDDPDPAIRGAVAELLPKYGPDAIAALPALAKAGGPDGPHAVQVGLILLDWLARSPRMR